MRIERIDDKTVKCYLSQEELAEYEITYKDFVTRTQKAKEMVEHIIAQAVEEVGYKPPEFAMDMQIMLMPDQGLILTLSEKTPDELKNNPTLMEYLREMKKAFEQKMAGADMTPENIEKLLTGADVPGVNPKNAQANEKLEEEGKPGQPDYAIFAFSSMRATISLITLALPLTFFLGVSLPFKSTLRRGQILRTVPNHPLSFETLPPLTKNVRSVVKNQ